MNPLRLCLGTLTVLPVRPPARVDRDVAGRAMLLAPLAGTLLAVLAGGALWLLDRVVSPLLAATLAVGLLALLTRGMHLDGLADTADGLGSRRPAAGALEVMRRGDVGPFGVVTLVVSLLAQVAALAAAPAAPVALAVALLVSRAALPLLCRRGVPPARPEGLGALVAGTVPPVAAAATALATVLLAGAVGWSTYGLGGVLAGVLALAAGAAYAAHCVRRFGGITGDVLGACVEVTGTAALVFLGFV
ncbi:adenosylcobinamide-GDP ribazoletransferase [Nocardioides panacis]|uniref:Adenosylcobinamide-GDP ribazoletransferase n=1 Tax=Nocardioides panacis TaxID=2849501 RepID=A0A975SV72_9ACTN|nr:adenosylcobinamide-GDP ribazoletransferase [Nocardioides panacis]QWZ06402.1 adenosylcobinamide-GDP ribazoletransferase [Nocardioides panacis]